MNEQMGKEGRGEGRESGACQPSTVHIPRVIDTMAGINEVRTEGMPKAMGIFHNTIGQQERAEKGQDRHSSSEILVL